MSIGTKEVSDFWCEYRIQHGVIVRALLFLVYDLSMFELSLH